MSGAVFKKLMAERRNRDMLWIGRGHHCSSAENFAGGHWPGSPKTERAHNSLTCNFAGVYSPRRWRVRLTLSHLMSQRPSPPPAAAASAVPAPSSRTDHQRSLLWLALSLTPGLGVTRARSLLARFESVSAIFHASLTELEAAGLRAESAQSIALGRSTALAEEELLRATSSG